MRRGALGTLLQGHKALTYEQLSRKRFAVRLFVRGRETGCWRASTRVRAGQLWLQMSDRQEMYAEGNVYYHRTAYQRGQP